TVDAVRRCGLDDVVTGSSRRHHDRHRMGSDVELADDGPGRRVLPTGPGRHRARPHQEDEHGGDHEPSSHFRNWSVTTNSSECGLAAPVLPWGQSVRLKSTHGVPSSSSRKLVSSVSFPVELTFTMQTLWSPSTPVRATK